jgi:hypothetical protein
MESDVRHIPGATILEPTLLRGHHGLLTESMDGVVQYSGPQSAKQGLTLRTTKVSQEQGIGH